MTTPLRVFIGYDHVEAKAFHTLCHSILTQASVPVSITPLALSQLKGIYTRDREPLQSNEFSFTRFLVPFLSGYEGVSMFMDCDMMLRTDIKALFQCDMENKGYAVRVVKHDHKPVETTKYLGATQTSYPCKNWSSVMLFNNAKCKALTPEYVNTAPGLDLHQFKWLEPHQVGSLRPEWNHLVGYNAPNPDAKIVHWTIGGPYFHEYNGCEYSEEWWAMYDDMNYCLQMSPAVPSEISEKVG